MPPSAPNLAEPDDAPEAFGAGHGDGEAVPGWYGFRTVWGILVGGTILTATLAAWFRADARRSDAARFEQLRHHVIESLDTRVERVEDLLRLLARAMSEHEAPHLPDWDEILDQASPAWNHPGVIAIGYATNHDTGRALRELDRWIEPATGSARPGFFTTPGGWSGPRTWTSWLMDAYRERILAREGFSAETVERTATDGTLVRRRMWGGRSPFATVPESAFYVERHLLEPEVRFRAPIPPPVVDAVCRDEVKITGRETVAHDDLGRPMEGATLLVPVGHPRRHAYWAALRPPSPRHGDDRWLRWQLNQGLVYAHLDFAALLRDIQGPAGAEIGVEIFTADLEPGTTNWLNPTGTLARALDPDFRPSYSVRHRWPMYGERWLLFFHSTPVFDRRSTRLRAPWASGLGALTTLLVGWAVGIQMQARVRESVRASELEDARNAVQATHRERERLGRDLHDGSIQALYAIQLGLSDVARQVEGASPAAARRLVDTRAGIDRVIRELRQFIQQLERPSRVPEGIGLAEVLEGYVVQLRAVSPVPIQIDCSALASRRLTPAQVVQLVGVAREALSNSLRHAGASKIVLSLVEDAAGVIFEARDDGAGFDLAAGDGRGLGLRTLRRRAAELGADLDLRTAPGQGTVIRLRLPTSLHEGPEERSSAAHG